MRIKKVVMTCAAVPSQWDAWDEDGQYYYIRYGHGRLTVETAAGPDEYLTRGDTNLVYAGLFGDEYDGVMSTEEMMGHIGAELTADAEVSENMREEMELWLSQFDPDEGLKPHDPTE